MLIFVCLLSAQMLIFYLCFGHTLLLIAWQSLSSNNNFVNNCILKINHTKFEKM